ncbi:hypothetical protein P692DRAFT_201857692 [Suillus brevipes Sb2]|nr:hypothetical protein P692DRAFT_201857692 [Suillus brevipes Sb2]
MSRALMVVVVARLPWESGDLNSWAWRFLFVRFSMHWTGIGLGLVLGLGRLGLGYCRHETRRSLKLSNPNATHGMASASICPSNSEGSRRQLITNTPRLVKNQNQIPADAELSTRDETIIEAEYRIRTRPRYGVDGYGYGVDLPTRGYTRAIPYRRCAVHLVGTSDREDSPDSARIVDHLKPRPSQSRWKIESVPVPCLLLKFDSEGDDIDIELKALARRCAESA